MASSDRVLAVGWTVAFLGAAVAASPWIALRLATDRRWRDGFGERLGGWPDSGAGDFPPRGWFWLHAASVGEIRIALRLAEALEAGPGAPRVRLTAFTPTGREAARAARPRSCFAPLDLPRIVGRRLVSPPRAYVALETELWPGLLLALRRTGVPAFIASARLSERSYSRYRRIGGPVRQLLSGLAGVFARDGESAERFTALGCPADRVLVTGDLKLDLPVPSPVIPAARFPSPDRVLAAASVHPGEETPLLEFFARVTSRRPDFTLLLAPRHLERVPWFLGRIAEWRLPVLRHSEAVAPGGDAGGRVYLVDTLGELPGLYHLAGAVFVGGTIAPVGGHNLMEPALAGKGVLFGPNAWSVAGMAELLVGEGGGIRVPDSQALTTALEDLFDGGSRLAALAAGAVRAAARGGGATRRTVEALRRSLGEA